MEIPEIGIGTYTIKNEEDIDKMLECAIIKNKYKMIDTAQLYKNHELIGNFLKRYNIREEVWITTKVLFRIMKKGKDKIRESIENTFKELKTEYIDLFLIHAPDEGYIDTWQVLREYQKEGKIKKLGVSNFNEERMKEFIKEIGEEKKYVYCNQIEVNPYLYRKELIEYCKNNGIKIIGYGMFNCIEDEKIKHLSEMINVKPAQLLISWCKKKGIIVIPMAIEEKYIKENITEIKIEEEVMREMDELGYDKDKYSKYPRYL